MHGAPSQRTAAANLSSGPASTEHCRDRADAQFFLLCHGCFRSTQVRSKRLWRWSAAKARCALALGMVHAKFMWAMSKSFRCRVGHAPSCELSSTAMRCVAGRVDDFAVFLLTGRPLAVNMCWRATRARQLSFACAPRVSTCVGAQPLDRQRVLSACWGCFP